MKKQTISQAMNFIDEKYIAEAETKKSVGRKLRFMRLTAAAACLAVLLAVGVPMLRGGRQINISENSMNIKVQIVDTVPKKTTMTSYSLLRFESAEELFSHFKLAIFRGEIVSIENIKISFNNESVYRALCEIKIDKTYQGNGKKGDRVKILLPCPITESEWTEDCDVVEQFRVGTKGIFMPIVYDETSRWTQNGATLMETDIAPYGLADGVRYCFIETENGLVFDRDSHSEIKAAATLDEVESYVTAMISRIN